MADNLKITYDQLSPGFEFPPRSFTLDAQTIMRYLEATGDSQEVYRWESLVPPMAVTALAMAALANSMTMPDGTIHVSQELDFLKEVRVGETITCYSRVSRKVERGGLRLMNTDITVLNQEQEKVLTGRVGFVLPDIGMVSHA